MIILDTNVISELMKAKPAVAVYRWVGDLRRQDMFTSAITQAEILLGLTIMPAGERREAQMAAAEIMFGRYFRDRILVFDSDAAKSYAAIVARRRRAGRPVDHFDAQIAATAHSRGLALATRDVTGFADCGIRVINPWTDRN